MEAPQRTCKHCGVTKDLDAFYNDSIWKTKTKRFFACRDCMNKTSRERYLISKDEVRRRTEKKQKAVDYLGGHCWDCGESYPLCVYDFHHIDPKTKDISPAKALSQTWDRLILELDKCALLCANCHRQRHFA